VEYTATQLVERACAASAPHWVCMQANALSPTHPYSCSTVTKFPAQRSIVLAAMAEATAANDATVVNSETTAVAAVPTVIESHSVTGPAPGLLLQSSTMDLSAADVAQVAATGTSPWLSVTRRTSFMETAAAAPTGARQQEPLLANQAANAALLAVDPGRRRSDTRSIFSIVTVSSSTETTRQTWTASSSVAAVDASLPNDAAEGVPLRAEPPLTVPNTVPRSLRHIMPNQQQHHEHQRDYHKQASVTQPLEDSGWSSQVDKQPAGNCSAAS